jgi:hypothetical protein
VVLIYDVVKYSTPYHGIFYHITKHDLLGNQQLFIDFKHIIILGATNAPNI